MVNFLLAMKVFISEQMLLDDYEVSVNCENLTCTIYSKCVVVVCVCMCVCGWNGMHVWMYVCICTSDLSKLYS